MTPHRRRARARRRLLQSATRQLDFATWEDWRDRPDEQFTMDGLALKRRLQKKYGSRPYIITSRASITSMPETWTNDQKP